MEGRTEMIIESDKKWFDGFFHTGEYFEDVTDVDLLRDNIECEKLYEYLQDEMSEDEKSDIKWYMLFAYVLGKYGW